jgi:hypothetical protein
MSKVIRQVSLAFALAAIVTLPALAEVAAPQHGAGNHAAPVSSERALREGMRKLWTDHVVWTREYVVAAVAGTPDASAAAKRLMTNQEDIGRAVASYYGQAAGDKLTALLKDHITVAVSVVNAAKAGDQAALQAASNKWKQNAGDIASFLASANPNWPRVAMVDAMNMHLETTTREVVARLQKDYDADVAAFDAVYEHILHMADVLSDGIIKQFPDRFAH